MKNQKSKNIIIPAVSLFIICLVVSALLALTNMLTKEPIAKNAKEKADNAMKSVCAYAEEFEEIDCGQAELICYKAKDSQGSTKGYAISSSAKGYGGDISVMVGINEQGEVTGVEILSHNETPGLGANCTTENFRADFLQKAFDGNFSVTKNGDGGQDGKVDAITGATISSKAVTEAVNKALDVFESLEGGEQ